ncbi:MAG: hypothetical protein LLG40_11305 [Deltaproteobacteria bacterium]|nr:hypothetical protein [Deltaproteobacteria bacterium]
MKLIFNEPYCNTHECCKHNPEYPNHCEILSNVDLCCLAQIRQPRCWQRALAWIDNHWLLISLTLAILSLIIFWSLLVFNAGNNAAIDSLRIRQEAEIKEMQRQITPAEWERRYKKHGIQTVIFEPGKHPYYRDAQGRKCRFI